MPENTKERVCLNCKHIDSNCKRLNFYREVKAPWSVTSKACELFEFKEER